MTQHDGQRRGRTLGRLLAACGLVGAMGAMGAAQAATLDFKLLNPSAGEVLTGGNGVDHLLNYTCIPANPPVAGDACANVVFTVQLDATSAAWVGTAGPALSNLPAGANATYDAGSRTVRVTVPSLPAVPQGASIGMRIVPPNLTTPNGTQWTVTGGVTSSNAGSIGPLPLTSTAQARSKLTIRKRVLGGAVAVVGDIITYQIDATCPPPSAGDLYIAPNGFTLTDVLPAGFQYVDSVPPISSQSTSGNVTTVVWNNPAPIRCAPLAETNRVDFYQVRVRVPANLQVPAGGTVYTNTATARFMPLGATTPVTLPASAASTRVYAGAPPADGNGWLAKFGWGSSNARTSFTQTGHWITPPNPRPTAPGHAEARYVLQTQGMPVNYSAELLDPVPCLANAQRDTPVAGELRYSSMTLPSASTNPFDPANLCQTPAFHPLTLDLGQRGDPTDPTSLTSLVAGGWRPQAVLTDGSQVPFDFTGEQTAANGRIWFKLPDAAVGRVALVRLPHHADLGVFYLGINGYADPALEAQFAAAGVGVIRLHNRPSIRLWWRGQPAANPHITIDPAEGYFRLRPQQLALGAGKEGMQEQADGSINLQLNALVQSAVDVTTPIVVTDLLPPGLVKPTGPYAGGVTLMSLGATVSDFNLPNFPYEAIANYNNSGRTLLRWTLPVNRPGTNTPLLPAGNWRVILRVPGNIVRADPTKGDTWVNTVRVYAADGRQIASECLPFGTVPSLQVQGDAANESGLGTDLVHCTASRTLTLGGTQPAGYTLTKQVQGNADAQAGSSGHATASGASLGSATYTLRWVNSGSTPDLRDVVLYDVLPAASGGQGSSSSAGRGSEFTAAFAGMRPLPAGVTVQYSASSNACRPEVFATGQPQPCVDDWASSLPAEQVRALRISAPGPFALGQSVEVGFDVNVQAPANANPTAYNDAASRVSLPGGSALVPVTTALVPLRVTGLPSIAAADDGSASQPFVTGTGAQPLAGNVAANDTTQAGLPLVYEIVRQPASGQLTPPDPANPAVLIAADGSFSYQPQAGFSGGDSFEYRVCYQGTSICATATVYLRVLAPGGGGTGGGIAAVPMNHPLALAGLMLALAGLARSRLRRRR